MDAESSSALWKRTPLFRTVGLPQGVTSDIPRWSYSVDSDKTRIPSNMVLLQGQATMIPTFPYGVDRRKISTLLAGVIPGIF